MVAIASADFKKVCRSGRKALSSVTCDSFVSFLGFERFLNVRNEMDLMVRADSSCDHCLFDGCYDCLPHVLHALNLFHFRLDKTVLK